MNMKKLIQTMTDIEQGQRQLNESYTAECGEMEASTMPMSAPMPAPENSGNPVTMSISLNASGMDHVADLMRLMQQAGLEKAGPVTPAAGPMRLDIEKFRDIVDQPKKMVTAVPVDDPSIPGRDDVEGDDDVQASVVKNIGTSMGQTAKHGAAGAGIGAALGGAAGAAGAALTGQNPLSGAAAGAKLGGMAGAGVGGMAGRQAATAKMTKRELQASEATDENLDEAVDPQALMGQIRKMAKGVETNPDEKQHRIFASQVESDLIDLFQYYNQVQRDTEKQEIVRNLIRQNKKAQRESDLRNANNIVTVLWDLMNSNESFENEPEEEYQDHNYMLDDLAGGLNKPKRMYKPAAGGDNPMAVETIKDRLYNALSEKKAKPDFLDLDGDGDTKEPMKKAAKDAKKKGVKEGGSTSVMRNKVEMNEVAPAVIPLVVAGARMAGPSLAKLGARILSGAGRGAAATPGAVATVGRGVGAAGTGVGIGAAGLAVNDVVQMAKQGIESLGPVIESILGSEALQRVLSFSSQYGLPILATIAILYGGKKVINYLTRQGKRTKGRQESFTNEAELDEISSDLAKRYTKAAKMDRDFNDDDIDRLAKSGQSTRDMHKKNAKRTKGIYRAKSRIENEAEVQEGAPPLSPKFIKQLQITFGDKPMLSPRETRKVEDMIDKISIENLKQLVSADIPNVSDMAKQYIRNNTPGGMKQEAEVQAPSHELSDMSRQASRIAQMIKRKINSGEQMDDRDYNQLAELGSVLSRLGASFGPKSMKDVMTHMKQYTDERNQEGHKYPEFDKNRFKELLTMAK